MLCQIILNSGTRNRLVILNSKVQLIVSFQMVKTKTEIIDSELDSKMQLSLVMDVLILTLVRSGGNSATVIFPNVRCSESKFNFKCLIHCMTPKSNTFVFKKKYSTLGKDHFISCIILQSPFVLFLTIFY